MGLQLADGEVKYPMGMLEDVNVNICGIPFVHTFAVVDFTQETNYDVILGQPFMRQMLVVQDWGYNRLYLCYQNSIVKVNLDDHTYCDVTRTPIEDLSLVRFKRRMNGKARVLMLQEPGCATYSKELQCLRNWKRRRH